MRSTLIRLLLPSVMTCSLVMVAVPAEAAQVWRINDVRRDGVFGIDIKQTSLDTELSGYFRVRIFGYEFIRERLNVATVFFDTRKANAGPEFRLSWGLPNDGVYEEHDGDDYRAELGKVDTWTSGGKVVACSRLRLAVNLSTDVVTMKIPRRCMGRPSAIRWNVETERIVPSSVEEDGSYSYYFDAAPRRRSFESNWVA